VATRLMDGDMCRRGVATMLAFVLSGSGCAGGPEGPVAAAAAPSNGSETEGANGVKSVPAAVLEIALDDAARRTAVARADIRVISADAVTWTDGSIGCPQPGMMYTQALVPGYRVVLQAGPEQMFYHAGRDGRPLYCPAARAQPPADVAVGR
jgi:hypothetical protein